VLKPENSLVWHREVLDWINKFTGLAKENGDSALMDDLASLGVSST
jgi:hypothetical protein